MEITSSSFWIAFGLTIGAGLATGLGSAIAFFAKDAHHRLLSIGLSFSAGVMLYVSFVEILPKAHDKLTSAHGGSTGAWYATLAFFVGMLCTVLVDRLVPTFGNPHEPHRDPEEAMLRRKESTDPIDRAKLRRTGLVAAVAIFAHNFPEGMATFFAALEDPKVGVALAVAVALHNIPEGVCVSVPMFYATGNRNKAFGLSCLSGLAEPLGALLGYALLMPYFTPTLMGVLFAGVAGIMVFVSLDELLPTAKLYAKGHDTVYGIVGGMAVMALSLLLMA